MRTDLPSGTVTFLFTDVEGSTTLLHELGAEGYAEALAEHRRLIREACAAEGGVEVDTQGDAFFFAFPTAPGALAAAAALTEGLAAGPIRVRVGLHTGTPLLTEAGYVGGDVHRAARIAAAGHGGQVLVSSSTAALLDHELRDLGEHRFKDLAAPERVYQLGEGSFPALKSLYRTNLPVPANPLVGRKKELVDVLRLVADDATRLVTITGPGGIGKTRFAIALAAEAADRYPDGVWFVDLSALRDAALVVPTISHALAADGDLARHLSDARCLLLLDNFEQVVGAASDVAELLGASRGVCVVATSREPLRIAAEREYALDPLPESPAVELFRHRAAAVLPDAEVAYETAAEICRRLDRLPLAIELAAARTRVFEPDALLERLEERLPVLVGRARDAPERQQTLRATIAWSYELLLAEEQQLFRRIAVFRGGSTLESIQAVTGAAPDLVESLVEKSLLRLRRGRLVMLETIREYAREQLVASGEDPEVRNRHAEHLAAVAESANLNAGALRPGGQRLEVALAEQDNVRGALSWTIAVGDPALGLRIATAIEQFWVVNDPEEGRRWFAALFALPGADDVEPGLRAQALRAWGSAADIAGDHEAARGLYERSLALHDELADDRGRAVLLHRLGIWAMREGELDRAGELVAESHAIHERHGDVWGLAQTIGTLGALDREAGRLDRASELVARSAAVAGEAGVPWWHAGMVAEQAALALEAGRVDEADTKAREGLQLVREMRDYGGRVLCVGILAGVAAERGAVERAGRLWGAIEDERVGAPLGGWPRHRAGVAARVEALAGGDLDEAIAHGRELSLDHAVEEALGED
jgi:predicted ATPase/class 3 adenylate cyclase